VTAHDHTGTRVSKYFHGRGEDGMIDVGLVWQAMCQSCSLSGFGIKAALVVSSSDVDAMLRPAAKLVRGYT